MARLLLPLSCLLLCPLMMGALMWGLGRDREKAKLHREVERINRRAAISSGQAVPARAGVRTLKRLWCAACINWKVVAALAGVAVAVLILRPSLLIAVGPVLLVLACPLSMVVAMLAMGRRGRVSASPVDRDRLAAPATVIDSVMADSLVGPATPRREPSDMTG